MTRGICATNSIILLYLTHSLSCMHHIILQMMCIGLSRARQIFKCCIHTPSSGTDPLPGLSAAFPNFMLTLTHVMHTHTHTHTTDGLRMALIFPESSLGRHHGPTRSNAMLKQSYRRWRYQRVQRYQRVPRAASQPIPSILPSILHITLLGGGTAKCRGWWKR